MKKMNKVLIVSSLIMSQLSYAKVLSRADEILSNLDEMIKVSNVNPNSAYIEVNKFDKFWKEINNTYDLLKLNRSGDRLLFMRRMLIAAGNKQQDVVSSFKKEIAVVSKEIKKNKKAPNLIKIWNQQESLLLKSLGEIVIHQGSLNTLNRDLPKIKTKLNELVSSYESEISQTQLETNQTRSELTKAQLETTQTRSELTKAQLETTQVRSELTKAQTEKNLLVKKVQTQRSQPILTSKPETSSLERVKNTIIEWIAGALALMVLVLATLLFKKRKALTSENTLVTSPNHSHFSVIEYQAQDDDIETDQLINSPVVYYENVEELKPESPNKVEEVATPIQLTNVNLENVFKSTLSQVEFVINNSGLNLLSPTTSHYNTNIQCRDEDNVSKAFYHFIKGSIAIAKDAKKRPHSMEWKCINEGDRSKFIITLDTSFNEDDVLKHTLINEEDSGPAYFMLTENYLEEFNPLVTVSTNPGLVNISLSLDRKTFIHQ